ncbi:MAG: pseudouridine synthase [Chlamydiales bacterium]|nr:pseudouridine synthase [Chlamydiales bacterium]
MTTNRLSKVLAAAGVASRRACEELIFEGHVQVNNKIVLLPQTLVSLEKDNILVAGKPIKRVESKVYYIVNKPPGYLCTNKAGSGKIILDLFPDADKRLFTVGRLDKETGGLIIVTNDGHFSQEVIHPSSNIQKEYVAKTHQEITDEHLKIISHGSYIEGTFVKPVKVSKVRKGTLKITITEGKKREVRILAEHAGLTLWSLTRIRIGSLKLGLLPVGGIRAMTERDKELIFE